MSAFTCIGPVNSDPTSQQTSSRVANFSDCFAPQPHYLFTWGADIPWLIYYVSFNSGWFTTMVARCKGFPQRAGNRENATPPSSGKRYEA